MGDARWSHHRLDVVWKEAGKRSLLLLAFALALGFHGRAICRLRMHRFRLSALQLLCLCACSHHSTLHRKVQAQVHRRRAVEVRLAGAELSEGCLDPAALALALDDAPHAVEVRLGHSRRGDHRFKHDSNCSMVGRREEVAGDIDVELSPRPALQGYFLFRNPPCKWLLTVVHSSIS